MLTKDHRPKTIDQGPKTNDLFSPFVILSVSEESHFFLFSIDEKRNKKI
jgi:hypothetical protein